jgi:hypothetical protein
MSYNLGSPSPIQPLSLGNVVTAGLRLYRSHLKSYLGLSAIAYLWVFVPVYGWAKLTANLALISRLAFGELVNQPEPINNGRAFVNRRLWQFLAMSLLMFVISIGLVMAFFIPIFIIIGLIAALAGISLSGGTAGAAANPAVFVVLGLLMLIFIPLFIVALLWIQARFFLVEVPLGVEDFCDATSTIGRSWDLTKGQVWRIIAIIIVAYLITLPITIPFAIVDIIIQASVDNLSTGDVVNSGLVFLLAIFRLVINLLSAIIVVPFWQTIKAVVYYDLRSRREGLGLKLRNHEI